MSDIAGHYELLEDDPGFGMVKGDVLACVPYDLDPEKLTVAFRLRDGFDPSCNVYRSQVRKVEGVTAIRWRREAPYGAEPDPDAAVPDAEEENPRPVHPQAEPPPIGDDAEAATAAQAGAQQDLTNFLVTLVATRSSGDHEDTYIRYFEDLARSQGIDLDAAIDEGIESGFFDGIDRPMEEVRREPELTEQGVTAICARLIGEPWEYMDRVERFAVAEKVVQVLNAARATGWTPPAGGGHDA